MSATVTQAAVAAAVEAAVAPISADLKAAVTEAVNAHVAKIQSQAAGVLAGIEGDVAHAVVTPVQKTVDAARDDITGAVHDAHDAIDYVVTKVETIEKKIAAAAKLGTMMQGGLLMGSGAGIYWAVVHFVLSAL